MNPKKIIGSVALGAVIAAAAWWFLQPAPAPAKVAAAPAAPKPAIPEAHYAVDPKSPALHPPPQPAMVMPPPVQRTAQPPRADPAPPPVGNPQADLKTALPDFVRILKTGDFLTLIRTYAPPGQIAQMRPEDEAQLQAQMQDPQMQQMMQGMASALESAQTQTPTYSPDGNTATYSNVPNYNGNPNQPTRDMIWIKENGQWYLKN